MFSLWHRLFLLCKWPLMSYMANSLCVKTVLGISHWLHMAFSLSANMQLVARYVETASVRAIGMQQQQHVGEMLQVPGCCWCYSTHGRCIYNILSHDQTNTSHFTVSLILWDSAGVVSWGTYVINILYHIHSQTIDWGVFVCSIAATCTTLQHQYYHI